MYAICHRCGDDLPRGDGALFCPHCGAPQLLLSEFVLADQLLSDSDTTGAIPPPLPRQVDWQAALGSAALVALIAAVLSTLGLRYPVFSLLGTIWTLTGAVITLALYQRRRPAAWMDAATGARIGLTAGLALVLMIAIGLAISGLVARFRLHAMAGFDEGLVQLLAQARQSASATPNPPPAEILRFYDLPEFQAGLVLVTAAIAAAALIAFSTLGGALGGMLRTRQTPQP